MQEPFYFRHKGALLAGTLHLPPGRSRCPAVALFHGFTGQRCEPNFIFVRLSRRLEEVGIASLRFDFRGSGESEGEFEDMTPLGEVSDGRAALRQLRNVKRIDPKRLGILGFSLGGLVAALVAAKEPALKSVVLWAAVARPERTRRGNLTIRQQAILEKTGRLDIGGMYAGRAFWRERGKIDPLAALARSKAPVLIVHGTGDKSVPYSDSTLFLRTARARGIRAERLPVDGANHVFSSVPWRNSVVEATVKWLRETLS
jgi:dipeptidyl aminopeptidase/acylaminoacyl peptidase